MFDGLIDVAGNLLRTLALGLLFAVGLGVYGLVRAWRHGTLDDDVADIVRLVGQLSGVALATVLFATGGLVVMLAAGLVTALLAWLFL